VEISIALKSPSRPLRIDEHLQAMSMTRMERVPTAHSINGVHAVPLLILKVVDHRKATKGKPIALKSPISFPPPWRTSSGDVSDADGTRPYRTFGREGFHAVPLGFALRMRYSIPMTETERELLHSLLELERTVKSLPTANPKPNLLPLFTRLDELTNRLPREADPTLLHYLHKKSYEKARLWLEDRDAENQAGNCHHV